MRSQMTIVIITRFTSIIDGKVVTSSTSSKYWYWWGSVTQDDDDADPEDYIGSAGGAEDCLLSSVHKTPSSWWKEGKGDYSGRPNPPPTSHPTPKKRISLGQLEEDGGKRWKRKELPGAGCWRRYAPLPSCWFSDENWKTSKSRNQIFTLLLSRSVGESEGREGAGEREEERRHSSPYSGASLHSGADGRTLWSSPSLGVTDASQAHTAPPYTTSLHSSSTFKSFQATNIMLRNPTQFANSAPCFLKI